MNILEVLEVFYSEYKWSIKGDDYESLKWSEDNPIPKPSLEELEDKWDNEKASIDDKKIQRERQMQILSEWPMEKQFEAITEFHMERPEKLNELLAHIQDVKDSNPKTS